MEIRPGTEEDTQSIIDLLKKSLGESLMPKSVQFWKWKHLDNPFGKSPVLLATDSNQIVGVRAFMRWSWAFERRIYHSVRAVDTATHPDYQGKGIFRKLTLSLVNVAKEQGLDFVYNTPNEKSKPGYLKMGWQEAGRLPIAIGVQRPFSIARNYFTRQQNDITPILPSTVDDVFGHPGLPRLIESIRMNRPMATDLSMNYLRWRYQQIPVASYFAMIDEKGSDLNALLIGRVKQTKMGRECRITDYFCANSNSGRDLLHQLLERKRAWNIDFTTISATVPSIESKLLGSLTLRAKVGPMVTVRPLELLDLSNLHNFANWAPSLGDLEVF